MKCACACCICTCSNFCFSKLSPVFHYLDISYASFDACCSHDECITVVITSCSLCIIYCVCTLQALKCPLFSAKCSHHACHPDYWYFFTNLLIGCYEAKVEESEKAGSRWESNPGRLWLEPPVLCQWPTEPRQPDDHQLSQSSMCILHRWYWMPQLHT